MAVFLFAGSWLPGSDGLVAGSALVLAAAVGAGMVLLAREGRSAGALGFPLRRAAVRETGLGTLLGAAVAGCAVAGIALSGGLRWGPEPGGVGGWLLGAGSALAVLAVPAAAEEALVRGYPLRALTEGVGPGPAVAVTALGFGLLHLPNPGTTALAVASIVAAGVFLGALVVRTGSLWWATGAHLGWNWAHGYVADVPVSGLELLDAPGVEARLSGPDWLSGGAFGPEGSVWAVAVLGAAAAWTWRTARLGPSSPDGEDGSARGPDGPIRKDRAGE